MISRGGARLFESDEPQPTMVERAWECLLMFDRLHYDSPSDNKPIRLDLDERKPAVAAYGRCGVPGCPCQGFTGTGMACNGCGHDFGQHL